MHKGATSATNRSHRQYRMEILDALIIRHDIVFTSNYAPLRETASSRQKPVDLLKKLSEEARGAKWLAVDAANRESNPDSALMEEWNQVIKKYPHLAKLTSETPAHQGIKMSGSWWDRLSKFF